MDHEPQLPAPYRDPQGPPSFRLADEGAAGREEEIDWRRWAYVLWRRKWWIVAATVLGTAPAVISARGYQPTYQSTAMVWIDRAPERGAPIEVTNVFTPAGWADLLTSYALLDPVVDSLRLYVHPAVPGDRPHFDRFELTDSTARGSFRLVVRPDRLYELVDARGDPLEITQPGEPLGAALGFRWTPPADLPTGREIAFSIRRPRSAADAIRRSLEVRVQPDGSFIRLTYRGQDVRTVTRTLNTILDHLEWLAADLKRTKLTDLVGTLEQQLREAEGRLRRAESELQNFRIRTITLPDDRPEGPIVSQGAGATTFDRYATLRFERDSLRLDRTALLRILRTFEQTGHLDVMKLEGIPSVQSASALLAALQELGRKEAEHRNLLYRYTPEHGSVKRLAADLAVLREQTLPGLIGDLVDRLAAREEDFSAQLRAHAAEMEEIPPRTIEEERLRREVALAAQLYNDLQVRYKQSQVAEAATQPNVRILDRASPTPYPIGGGPFATIVVAFVLSFGLGVVGVILYERFVERRVQYPEQVVRDLRLPILGAVPNLKMLEAGPRNGAPSSPHVRVAIESFRGLRTRLTRGLGLRYPAVIAVTSPGEGDGKSIIAANLALAFADPHRTTVLIDGDMRRGGLHKVFAAQRSPGLAEYLRNGGEITPIVQETETPGLCIISRGAYSEEASELLDGDGVSKLVDRLRETFKVILIDTPPLAAGVDSILLGMHADAVLAVIRAGQTDLELARAKLAAYAQMLRVPILGAVLNDVRPDGPYRYHTYAYEVHLDE